MDLIEKIRNDDVLQEFIEETCEENSVCIHLDEKITNFVIIKVDKYYNSLHKTVLASPDCLIIYECINNNANNSINTYSVAIVELKAISENKKFNFANLTEKFETCFNDFMGDKFSQYFDKDFQTVKLFFITKLEKQKAARGQLEVLISKVFKFRNKKYLINWKIETLKPCYCK